MNANPAIIYLEDSNPRKYSKYSNTMYTTRYHFISFEDLKELAGKPYRMINEHLYKNKKFIV